MGAGKRELERIIKANEGFVRGFAMKLFPIGRMAEDIAQQVFLEFIQKKDKWDFSRDMRPLLANMTKKIAGRFWREKRNSMTPQMGELADYIREQAGRKEISWFTEEETEALKRCIEKLSKKSREMVVTHYYLDVSSAEISRRLSVAADSIRHMLFRIRAQLRKCIRKTLAGVDNG